MLWRMFLSGAMTFYVKIDSAYWDDDFTVKISNENMADYRTWLSGEEEMPVKGVPVPEGESTGIYLPGEHRRQVCGVLDKRQTGASPRKNRVNSDR
jgi:hypothetical protein